MIDIIGDPDAFFERRTEHSKIFTPIIIVLLAGLTNSLPTILLLPIIIPTNSGIATKTITTVGFLFGSIAGLLSIVGIWILYASAFYLLSAYFTGSGSFRTLIRFTGWGFFPIIIRGLFMTVVVYFVVESVTVPSSPEATNQLINSISGRSEIILGKLCGIIFSLWSGFIWIFALKHARKLNIRDASKVVSLPVLTGIGFTITTLM